MKIGDILNVAGSLPLKQFEFGEALVQYFNQVLAEHIVASDQLLSVDDTGEDARLVLYRLPSQELATLIMTDFDPGSHKVLEPAAPAAGLSLSPPPQETPPEVTPRRRSTDAPYRRHDDVPPVTPLPSPAPVAVAVKPEAPVVEPGQLAKSRMALAMSGGLLLIALMLAISMSASTVKRGTMPDSSALKSVMEILGEVVKEYMKKPSATPTE